MSLKPQTVIIDNGTGNTKMGYAGNEEPTYVIPSYIADCAQVGNIKVSRMVHQELDYHIGFEAQKHSQSHAYSPLLEAGEIKDFQLMEKFWHRCIFDNLRCEPEEHNFVLTEPPMNSPENRETMAEIMFETFNVKGLHISVQATCALYSSWWEAEEGSVQKKLGLTGTVIDSGDGVTHIIPISDGYVIGSCVRHIPLAGKDITKYIMRALRDRKVQIDQSDLMIAAKDLKETYAYVAIDPLREFEQWDDRLKKYQNTETPEKAFKNFKTESVITGKDLLMSIGYECFMGPEMWFRPEIIDPKWTKALQHHVDETIQQSPIDIRRNLYKNIVLSGGSTTTTGLRERLIVEQRKIVDDRAAFYKKKTGVTAPKVEVDILENPHQSVAVFHGASMMAITENFQKAVHTREEYLEKGSSVCRHNAVFANC